MPIPYRKCRFLPSLLLASSVFVLLHSTGCQKTDAPAAARKGPPAVPVSVTRAAEKEALDVLSAVGSAEAASTVTVRAQVTAPILKAHFQEGQEVRKGQILFTLDTASFVTALQKAEAALARDRALARQAEADAVRLEELVRKDYVTRQQYESARTNAESLQAVLRSDETAIADARLSLSYCTVRAPEDGRTGVILAYPGNLTRANDTPLVVLSRVHPINVAFSIPEGRLADVRKAMAERSLPVSVTFPNGEKETESGKLVFIDSAVAPGTGTIVLKAQFPNAKSHLWPGQFLTASLVLGRRESAVMVPARAIQAGQEGSYAFVIQDGKAVMRKVRTGIIQDGWAEVESGISTGETVVIDGHLRLVPGATVSVKTSPDDMADPSAVPRGDKK